MNRVMNRDELLEWLRSMGDNGIEAADEIERLTALSNQNLTQAMVNGAKYHEMRQALEQMIAIYALKAL